jgi:hypothetical protein
LQFPSKSQWHSSQRLKNLPYSSFGNAKDDEQTRQYWAERAMLEVSQYLPSDYTTEP